MRLSLLQLARLRGWNDTTINLIEQAITDTPDCPLDIHTEWDIDLPWLESFKSLRPALDAVLLDQFGVDLSRIAEGPPAAPLTALQRASAPYLLAYIEAMSATLAAVHDSLEHEIGQELAVKETARFLGRFRTKGFPSG